jgi:hypothetical protein
MILFWIMQDVAEVLSGFGAERIFIRGIDQLSIFNSGLPLFLKKILKFLHHSTIANLTEMEQIPTLKRTIEVSCDFIRLAIPSAMGSR